MKNPLVTVLHADGNLILTYCEETLRVPEGSRFDSFLYDAALDVNRFQIQLEIKAANLGARLTELSKRVERGERVNNLGEVQGGAVQLDILCAKLEAAREMLEALWKTASQEVAA